MALDSAKVFPVPEQFPWIASVPTGTLTPLENPGSPFDWTVFANRDKDLAYRDTIVATNVSVLSIEIETIWGAKATRPIMPGFTQTNLPAVAADREPFVATSGTVVHVSGSSLPIDALTVDRQLYGRDLLVQETMARSADILSTNPVIHILSGSNIYTGSISQAWSLGSGSSTQQEINPVLPLDVNLFKKPDQTLAYRDNVNAGYVARLQTYLEDPFAFAKRISVQVSNTDAREAETYVLAEESITQKVFQAEPALEGRMRIVYDKRLRTVQWVNEDALDLHIPQSQPYVIGSVKVTGIDTGQEISFVPSVPANRDMAFWKQKAEKMYFSNKRPINIFSTLEPASYLTSGGVASGDAVAISSPETVRLNCTGTLRQGVNSVAVLFAVDPNLLIKGGQNVEGEAVTSDGGSNMPTSGGTLSYSFSLPAGTWNAKVRYKNAAGTQPDDFKVDILVTGMANRSVSWRYGIDNVAVGAIKTVNVPITTTSASQIITFSWTPTSDEVLRIIDIDFISTFTSDLEMEIETTLRSASGIIDNPKSAVISAKRYRKDVLVFNFSNTVEETPIVDIELKTDIEALFTIYGIQVYHWSFVSQVENAVGFEPVKSQYLKRGFASVLNGYASFVAEDAGATTFHVVESDGSYSWTATSTYRWMQSLKVYEERLFSACRISRPGDIGRPAILPEGLEPILEATGTLEPRDTRANFAVPTHGRPVLRPLQAWMIPLGIYVVDEAFWGDEDQTVVNVTAPASGSSGSGDTSLDLTDCIITLSSLSGGGNSFECYVDGAVTSNSLGAGPAFSGNWITGPNPLGLQGIDDFEAYTVGAVTSDTLAPGDGFTGNWIVGDGP